MAADQYYIRSRGRVSGPFSLDAVQKLARRGTVSRFDEVSADQIRWDSAQSAVDGTIFAAPSRPSTATREQVVPPVPASSPVPPPTSNASYFYSQRGVEVGPIDANVLRSLASTGAISPADLVWSAGSQAAFQACQIPVLVSVFTAGPAGQPPDEGSDLTAADLSRSRGGVDHVSMVVGIVAGGLVLLLVNFPIIAGTGMTRWWWDADSGTALFIGAAYSTLAGIAFILMSILTRGLGRAVSCLAVAGTGVVATAFCTLFSDAGPTGRLFAAAWLLSPAVTIIGAAVARWRTVAGWQCHRGTCSTFGSIVIAVHVVMGITVAIVAADDHPALLPSWVRLLEIFSVLQCLSGTGAGVVSIVSGSSGSLGFRKASLLLSIVTIGFAIISVVTLIGGLGSTADFVQALATSAGTGDAFSAQGVVSWIMFMFVRMFVVLACYVAVIGGAFMGILAASSGPTSRNPNR